MSKLKKILFISIGIIAIAAVVVIVFVSPITKYLVEKYDKKYMGRQITMDWAYVNPFTSYIHISNLKIYELNSDSVFFSANGLSANITMYKVFSKTYEISEISIDQPRCTIIQNKKDFNFNDLVEKFSSKDSADTTKAGVHFSILSIKINDGAFYYHEKQIPINYFIRKVNFESTGKRWDADTVAAKFSLLPGIGSGDMKGNFTVNLKNKDYRIAIVIQKFDLNIIAQYLKDLTNYGSFSANLDANIKSSGNFTNKEDVTTKGRIAINNFHFGKTPKEDYASFDKLAIAIHELSPKNHTYSYDSVILSHPYLKYERYDYLDNLQTMFGKKGSNLAAANASTAKFNLVIEIANHIKVLSRNFFRSNYKVNRLAIYNGDLQFNDYSISEKFSMNFNPLNMTADSINRIHHRVKVFLKSDIRPYGKATMTLSINPKDSSDFDMQYHLQKLPASMFNPYLISYTSFPLDRGTLELNGKWHVSNGMIQSENHLLVIDPRASKRLRNKDRKWLPIPLIMAFIRERGNVIDYNIPISGNLKNPKFHLHDIIFDLLKNIFVKPPTTPYGIQVKNIEAEIEKSLTLKWQMRQNSLIRSQEKFIEKMADFLKKNNQAFIAVYPQQYAIKEKEYILLFEAKKKYFLAINNKSAQSFDDDDSEKVDKMSVKDPLFVSYLNKRMKTATVFTIQDKCAKLINSATIDAKFTQLNKERVNAFMSYFKENGLEKQVKVYAAQSVIPFNGFSFYKIKYKGATPESLIEAYQKMNKLNDEDPRKKFKKERRRNARILPEKGTK